MACLVRRKKEIIHDIQLNAVKGVIHDIQLNAVKGCHLRHSLRVVKGVNYGVFQMLLTVRFVCSN